MKEQPAVFGVFPTAEEKRPGDNCAGHLDELPQSEWLRIEIGLARVSCAPKKEKGSAGTYERQGSELLRFLSAQSTRDHGFTGVPLPWSSCVRGDPSDARIMGKIAILAR